MLDHHNNSVLESLLYFDIFAVDLTLVDGEEDCLYFCSNSLGLMPRNAEEKLSVEFQKWAEM